MGLRRRCRRYPRLSHRASEAVLRAAKTKTEKKERNARSLKSPLLVLSYVFGGVSTHQRRHSRDKVSIRSSSAAREEAKRKERAANTTNETEECANVFVLNV